MMDKDFWDSPSPFSFPRNIGHLWSPANYILSTWALAHCSVAPICGAERKQAPGRHSGDPAFPFSKSLWPVSHLIEQLLSQVPFSGLFSWDGPFVCLFTISVVSQQFYTSQSDSPPDPSSSAVSEKVQHCCPLTVYLGHYSFLFSMGEEWGGNEPWGRGAPASSSVHLVWSLKWLTEYVRAFCDLCFHGLDHGSTSLRHVHQKKT